MQEPVREKRNVLFIVIDTLRADACFGENRTVKTPTIDSLKKQGTSFTQAISVASVTATTIASMLTGLYPFSHGVSPSFLEIGRFNRPAHLNRRCATLPELLQRHGYHTVAMVTGPLIRSWGLDRGFERYFYRGWFDTIYTDWGKKLKESIKANRFGEPWFLFLHLWEVHAPRTVLRPFNQKRYGRNRYERALSCLDHELQELLKLIDLGRTIVLVHGDHGENVDFPPLFLRPLYTKVGLALNRKLRILKVITRARKRLLSPQQRRRIIHWTGHGDYVYEYLVRVPLIVVGRGIIPEGKIVDDQVSQVDIFPTVLDALGLGSSLTQRIHGRSLLPLAEGKPLSERPVYFETGFRVGIRLREWKLVLDNSRDGVSELFNLKRDPAEKNNLIAREVDMTRTLTQTLKGIQSLRFDELSPTARELSEEEQRIVEKKLVELGYM
jgi:arylsulfatase